MDVPFAHSYPRSPSPAPPIPLPRSISPSYSHDDSDTIREVPIPWRAFFPILFFCCADAMTYAVVFPFITDMITSFDVPEDKIGLYSGFGEGVMMLVEACMATTWARLADKKGRRWCMLWGFSVTVIAMPFLGFSKAVWQVVLCRALLGLNSTGVLVKICATEIGHPSNRTRMFSILSPAFGIGFLVSTFLGGELAHPYGRLPWWLGGTVGLYRDHPYVLPCLVVLVFDILAIVGGYLYLPETQRTSKESMTMDMEKKNSKKSPYMETLRVPSFVLAVAVTCLFHVSYFSWDGMFGVFTYTSTDNGGLGLHVDNIGILYAVGAGISIFAQPVLLAPFRKAVGERAALTIVLGAWTGLALVIPISQWTAANIRALMWAALGLIISLKSLGNFAWPMTDVLTMAAFDDYPELMATGSAISLIASAGGRAFGPAISGWLFSISTQYPTGSFGRQISWVYLLIVTIPGVVMVQMLPPSKDESRPSKSEYEQLPLVESGSSSSTNAHYEENADTIHARA